VKQHLRLDFGGVRSGPRVTSQGFLKLDGVLGRCGVNRYTRDGKVVRELRLPEEVFSAESMESFAGAPLTYLHPPVTEAWLTRKSWRDYEIGSIGDTVKRLDGDFMGGVVTVKDDARVQETVAGKLRELSPGYRCVEMEMKPGVHELYGAYDCIQRGIIGNHVGFGPRGWGRQGREVEVKLDGSDAGHVGIMRLDQSELGEYLRMKIANSGLTLLEVAQRTNIIEPIHGDPLKFSGSTTQTWILESIIDGWTPRPTDAQLESLAKVLQLEIDDLIRLLPDGERRFDGHSHAPATRSKRMAAKSELKLDGLTVELEQRDHDVVRKAIDERDKQIVSLTGEKSALQAKLDGVTEKLTLAEKALTEAPAKVRAEVESRVKLEATAQRFGVKLDGLTTETAIKQAVILKLKPKADLTGKDEAYINARFDSAVEDAGTGGAAAAAETNPGLAKLTQVAATPTSTEVRVDGGSTDEDPDPEAARKARLKTQGEAWQKK
jgi:hypothetical protein